MSKNTNSINSIDNECIKFQVLDWDEYHSEGMSGEMEYRVRLFGRTSDDKTICCDVHDFTPYFYVKVKQNWTVAHLNTFIQELKKRIWPADQIDGLKKFGFVEAYDFYGFTNYTKFKFIRLEFINLTSFKAYDRAFKKKFKINYIDRFPFKLKVYESNIIPFLRMMHIRKLGSVGWIQIKKEDYKYYKKADEPTTSEVNIYCSFNNLEPFDEIKSQKFTIASFDIECTSIDGSFPNPKRPGDKVIQIGLTLSRYGEDECYAKYILTLNGCTSIANTIVRSYDEESELLKGFTRLIKETDPDIISGYNIFGFDFVYLYERAKLLDVEPYFSRLSRIKNQPCEFVEQQLASSALGENILKYYKMPGRVVFDLMKVVQRDYRLPSYKLDEVASNFIRENISKIDRENNKSIINTKNTNGIYIDQFIKICYNDGMTENKYNEGQKFKILELTKNTITIDEEIDTTEFMNKGFKVFWTQAKDDISPNEIFSLQEKTDVDRALIAKYCVQDCALCNKLIARLQIITNSIGMATVCHVPLSFLFLRGQGVKIFSLVAKKCREKNHLIPVIKKKFKPDENQTGDKLIKETERIEKYLNNKHQQYDDDDEEEDEMGYEGATVFEPKTGVHMEPIPVLDYGSLYPNSMRLRNLSHEMYVNDDAYKNLPGYIYHEIKYKNADGTFTECMFAEKQDGTKSILHEIITELLTARKKYKNQMEDLKENGGDSFVIAILDGLQMAYKVTANSLYGQTGAPTSPIYMKQIAASTTATGREMLQFSKIFIEQMFSKVIKLALEAYETNDKTEYLNYMAELFKYHPTKLKFDNGEDLHIETIENKPIADAKFNKKSIELYIKSYEDMLKKYSEDLKKFNITTVEEYEKIIKTLQDMPYEKQSVIYNKLKDIFDETIAINTKNVEVMEIFKIDDKKQLREIKETKWTENFPGDFLEIFHNIGYKNRDEMYLKVYDMIQLVLNRKDHEYIVDPKGIYGDTDSIFYCLHIKDKNTGEIVKDKRSLIISIKFGIWSSLLISTLLPAPMVMEYEKVLWPFIILTKKRYVGNLYEKSPDKFYQKSMGIVLKRRDNANVVKIVVGNIVDQILNKQSTVGAVKMTQDLLSKIIRGKIPIDKFIITKTLKTTYKDRTRIVHAVLADRMAIRDPGNKPQSNDRIPYAYIEVPEDKVINLQGDRVEHWDYIIENNIKLDYLFYITNQIMKPSIQFLELIVDKADRIFKEYIIREENRKAGKMPFGYYLQGENNINFDDFANIIDKECKNAKNNSTKSNDEGNKEVKQVKNVKDNKDIKKVKRIVKPVKSKTKSSKKEETKNNQFNKFDFMLTDFS
jgi:DNA polymerase elongation subunit (family B)